MSKQRVSRPDRRFVFRRANGCCEYCKCRADFATQSLVTEHIIPSVKGGSDDLENLALACQGCNSHKAVKTEALDPVSKQLVPLFHPRQQKWREHFNWDESYTQILGLTPTGRATVEALRLNRPELLRLRAALFLLGEHPPVE